MGISMQGNPNRTKLVSTPKWRSKAQRKAAKMEAAKHLRFLLLMLMTEIYRSVPKNTRSAKGLSNSTQLEHKPKYMKNVIATATSVTVHIHCRILDILFHVDRDLVVLFSRMLTVLFILPFFSPQEFASYMGKQGFARKMAENAYKTGPEAVARRKSEKK